MQRTAVIVDDHPMCRHATMLALTTADPALTIVEAGSIAEARTHAARATLMTLDLVLPDNRGVLGLPALRAEFPHLLLLVISGASNPEIEQQVAAAGAQGYLSKAARISDMVAAIRALLRGETWFSAGLEGAGGSDFARLTSLTGAQTRVLIAMEGGRLNKQIAYDLGLSEITVKAHVKAILRKLEVANRTQAILMLQRAQA